MDRAKTAVNKSWDALVQHCLLPALEFINQAHDRYDNVQIIAAGSAGVLLLVTGAVAISRRRGRRQHLAFSSESASIPRDVVYGVFQQSAKLVRHEGACLCGRVKFTVLAPAQINDYVYAWSNAPDFERANLKRATKHFGAKAAAAAAFDGSTVSPAAQGHGGTGNWPRLSAPVDNFELVSGADQLHIFEVQGTGCKRLFCKQCGSSPFYFPEDDDEAGDSTAQNSRGAGGGGKPDSSSTSAAASPPSRIEVNVECLHATTIVSRKTYVYDGANMVDRPPSPIDPARDRLVPTAAAMYAHYVAGGGVSEFDTDHDAASDSGASGHRMSRRHSASSLHTAASTAIGDSPGRPQTPAPRHHRHDGSSPEGGQDPAASVSIRQPMHFGGTGRGGKVPDSPRPYQYSGDGVHHPRHPTHPSHPHHDRADDPPGGPSRGGSKGNGAPADDAELAAVSRAPNGKAIALSSSTWYVPGGAGATSSTASHTAGQPLNSRNTTSSSTDFGGSSGDSARPRRAASADDHSDIDSLLDEDEADQKRPGASSEPTTTGGGAAPMGQIAAMALAAGIQPSPFDFMTDGGKGSADSSQGRGRGSGSADGSFWYSPLQRHVSGGSTLGGGGSGGGGGGSKSNGASGSGSDAALGSAPRVIPRPGIVPRDGPDPVSRRLTSPERDDEVAAAARALYQGGREDGGWWAGRGTRSRHSSGSRQNDYQHVPDARDPAYLAEAKSAVALQQLSPHQRRHMQARWAYSHSGGMAGQTMDSGSPESGMASDPLRQWSGGMSGAGGATSGSTYPSPPGMSGVSLQQSLQMLDSGAVRERLDAMSVASASQHHRMRQPHTHSGSTAAADPFQYADRDHMPASRRQALQRLAAQTRSTEGHVFRRNSPGEAGGKHAGVTGPGGRATPAYSDVTGAPLGGHGDISDSGVVRERGVVMQDPALGRTFRHEPVRSRQTAVAGRRPSRASPDAELANRRDEDSDHEGDESHFGGFGRGDSDSEDERAALKRGAGSAAQGDRYQLEGRETDKPRAAGSVISYDASSRYAAMSARIKAHGLSGGEDAVPAGGPGGAGGPALVRSSSRASTLGPFDPSASSASGFAHKDLDTPERMPPALRARAARAHASATVLSGKGGHALRVSASSWQRHMNRQPGRRPGHPDDMHGSVHLASGRGGEGEWPMDGYGHVLERRASVQSNMSSVSSPGRSSSHHENGSVTGGGGGRRYRGGGADFDPRTGKNVHPASQRGDVHDSYLDSDPVQRVYTGGRSPSTDYHRSRSRGPDSRSVTATPGMMTSVSAYGSGVAVAPGRRVQAVPYDIPPTSRHSTTGTARYGPKDVGPGTGAGAGLVRSPGKPTGSGGGSGGGGMARDASGVPAHESTSDTIAPRGGVQADMPRRMDTMKAQGQARDPRMMQGRVAANLDAVSMSIGRGPGGAPGGAARGMARSQSGGSDNMSAVNAQHQQLAASMAAAADSQAHAGMSGTHEGEADTDVDETGSIVSSISSFSKRTSVTVRSHRTAPPTLVPAATPPMYLNMPAPDSSGPSAPQAQHKQPRPPRHRAVLAAGVDAEASDTAPQSRPGSRNASPHVPGSTSPVSVSPLAATAPSSASAGDVGGRGGGAFGSMNGGGSHAASSAARAGAGNGSSPLANGAVGVMSAHSNSSPSKDMSGHTQHASDVTDEAGFVTPAPSPSSKAASPSTQRPVLVQASAKAKPASHEPAPQHPSSTGSTKPGRKRRGGSRKALD